MKEISITWDASPELRTLKPAISGSMFTNAGREKFVLTPEKPLILNVERPGPVVLQGQFPSGETVQIDLHLEDDQKMEHVVFEYPHVKHPELALHAFLGNYPAEPPEISGGKAKGYPLLKTPYQ